MSQNWFFKTLGTEFGPISFDKLAQRAQTGELSPDDPVRAENNENWQIAEQVVSFIVQEKDAASETDMVTSLLSQAEEFEEFDSIDEFILENEDDHSRQSASLEQFLNQHTQSDPESLKSNPRLADDDFELAETVPVGEMVDWHAKVLDMEFGPFSLLELQTKIAEGNVGKSDFIKQGHLGSWEPAKNFTEFDFPQIVVPKKPVVPEPATPQGTPPVKAPLPKETLPETQKTTETQKTPLPPIDPPTQNTASAPNDASSEFQQTAINNFTAVIDEHKKVANTSADHHSQATRSTPPASKKPPKKKITKTPIHNKPTYQPKKRSKSRDLSLSFPSLETENLKYGAIAVAMLGIVYFAYTFLWADPGIKYYHQLTSLWSRTLEVYEADPNNFKEVSAPLLAEAEEIMDELSLIPNTSSRLVANVKSLTKDGIIPFLKKRSTSSQKELVESYLKNATLAYEE